MDYEIDNDTSCPKCANELTHYRRCTEPHCNDGQVDVSDEFFAKEGTFTERCSECNGSGHIQWCPSCGHVLSPDEVYNWTDDDDFDDEYYTEY